jgi:hypothetical protein
MNGASSPMRQRGAGRRARAALIERGLSAERPVMILSGNAIDHALLMLAATPPAFRSRRSRLPIRCKARTSPSSSSSPSLLEPGLIYVADTGAVRQGAGGARSSRRNRREPQRRQPRRDAVRRSRAHATRPAVDKPRASIGATRSRNSSSPPARPACPRASSTRTACSPRTSSSSLQCWPFLAEQPLTLVDWLPWNHTFGGNHNFNMVLRHAGTLVIDGGPAASRDDRRDRAQSHRNSPTIYFNVPAGYAALLPHLERDENLARSFFKNLRLIFYAAAALPQDLWERLEALSMRTVGHRVPMSSSWGTTETAPLATAAHYRLDRAGNIGVPARRRGEAGAERSQARDSRARAERHAGLLEAAGSHSGRVRRRRLLHTRATRCALPTRRSLGRRHLRRPARRGFQADDRDVGARRRVARWRARRVLAGAAGRDRRGREQGVHRIDVLAQPTGLSDPDRKRRAVHPTRAGAASHRARARAPRSRAMERRACRIVGADRARDPAAPMHPRSTRTRSPTRATSTSASRSNAGPRRRAPVRGATGRRCDRRVTSGDRAPLACTIGGLLGLSQHIEWQPGLRHVDDVLRAAPRGRAPVPPHRHHLRGLRRGGVDRAPDPLRRHPAHPAANAEWDTVKRGLEQRVKAINALHQGHLRPRARCCGRHRAGGPLPEPGVSGRR